MTSQLQGHVRGHGDSCEVLVVDLGPSFLGKKLENNDNLSKTV